MTQETIKKIADFATALGHRRIIKVLYLDLDGTVRKGFDELGRFVNTPADVDVFESVSLAMAEYRDAGWKIVAITNQGGVALGHLSMEDMIAALAETQKQTGNRFDSMYACRHHPDALDPRMASCWCRKPRIGALVSAAETLSLKFNGICPPSEALFVGDRDEDRQCAANAGIRFINAKDWRAGAR